MNRITRLLSCGLSLLLVPLVPAPAQEAGSALEIAPEEVVVDIAPVEAVVRDLPRLPELGFEAPPVEDPDLVAVPAGDISPPGLPREAVLPGEVAQSAAEEVFFNATLGGGSVNSVLGSINVFRLGDGPQFRVGYDHRGSDGFNFTAPGSGFFQQENALDTWIRLGEGESLQLEAEARYEDRRFGLQGQPRYYSADQRLLGGVLDLSFQPEPQSRAGLRLELEDRRRVLAVATSEIEAPRASYQVLRPELRGRLDWARLSAELVGSYEGRFSSGDGPDLEQSSLFGLELGLEAVPLDGLTLRLQGATRYRIGDGAYFPVEGGLAYQGAERWGLELSGGLRTISQSPTDHWEDYVVTSGTALDGARVPLARRVFADGRVDVSLIPALLELGAGARWSRTDDELTVQSYDDDAAVAAHPLAVANRRSVRPQVDARIALGPSTSLSLGWETERGDLLPGAPEQELSASVEYNGERLAGSASLQAPLTAAGTVPRVDAELAYRVARDVDVRLFGDDLLAPWQQEGRTRRGLAPSSGDPLVTPGFELGLAVRVSF